MGINKPGPGDSVYTRNLRGGGEATGDDVEGHAFLKASDEDDTEGHGSMLRARGGSTLRESEESDEDDTEGHGSMLKARGGSALRESEESDGDDTEGHSNLR